MPYISRELRERLDGAIETLLARMGEEGLGGSAGLTAGGPGVVNYVITRIVAGACLRGGTNYAKINEAVGVLECAKLEFYRRLAGPYEDKKIDASGDVKEYGGKA